MDPIHEQLSLTAAFENDSPAVPSDGPVGAFAGTMDEIEIDDRNLTAQEVIATTLQRWGYDSSGAPPLRIADHCLAT